MAFRADSGRLGLLAGRIDGISDAVPGLAAGVAAALTASGHGPAAAGVAATLGSIDAWAGTTAADLRRRIAILESGGPGLTSGPVFAPVLPSPRGGGADPVALRELWALAFTMCPTPEAVARLFATMDPADAREAVARWPEAVGPLEGAPLELRFAANRLLIRRRLAMVRERMRAGPAGGTSAALLGEEAALESFLAGDRRFVLFDGDGDGRIAEWHGPSDAANVAFHVPGTGSSLLTFDASAARSERMLRHDPSGGELAVVTTLVFDAPDHLAAAALTATAGGAAPHLVDFIGGLRLGDRHLTVLGHSYGSTTLGFAFRHGLGDVLDDDDDVVVIGSPGLGVDSVESLPHPRQHVWAGLTDGDEIQLAVDPVAVIAETACRQATGAAFGVVPHDVCPSSEGRLIHGADPVHPDFGAQVFDTGPNLPPDDWWRATEHGEYWATVLRPDGTEAPSEALRNILAIATARYHEVTGEG